MKEKIKTEEIEAENTKVGRALSTILGNCFL